MASKTWGDVYYYYLHQGMDHGDARYRADQWLKQKTYSNERVLKRERDEILMNEQPKNRAERRAAERKNK